MLLLVVASSAIGPAQLRAGSFATVYSFQGGNDGAVPIALSVGENCIYGISGGGAADGGTVFSLCPTSATAAAWTHTVIHTFAGGLTDGSSPVGLEVGAAGILYGTTTGGGRLGGGIIFSLAPVAGGKWIESVLYNFPGGANPSGISIGLDGAIYGATERGGTGSCEYKTCGTVYSLTPPVGVGAWTLTTLHEFTAGPDGATPFSAPVIGKQGVLYGSTPGGGTGGGVVYSVTPPQSGGDAWTEYVLHIFGSQGLEPWAGITLSESGTIYGTVYYGGSYVCGDPGGCGGVYGLKPPSTPGDPWSGEMIFQFSAASGGYNPQTSMMIGADGVLYGTTYLGGANGLGTLYALRPPAAPGGRWVESVVHSFAAGADSSLPGAIMIDRLGVIYGVTHGATDNGIVFSYSTRIP